MPTIQFSIARLYENLSKALTRRTNIPAAASVIAIYRASMASSLGLERTGGRGAGVNPSQTPRVQIPPLPTP